MGLLALFFNSFMVGFSGAVMPGPVLAVGIAETPRHGWRAGPILIIGHSIAEIGVVVILSIGFAALAENHTVTSAIGILGGVALILMGIFMAIDVLRGKVNYDPSQSDTPPSRGLLAGKGFTASLSNPYWFVWWGTTGSAFIVKSLEFGVAGPVVFYFGHILSDFVWYSAVSLVVWRGKRLLMGRGLQVLILVCAAFLLYLGTAFIIDGPTS